MWGETVCFLNTTVSYFLICSIYQNFTRQCGDQPWSFNTGSQPGVILLFLGGLAMSRDISGCHAWGHAPGTSGVETALCQTSHNARWSPCFVKAWANRNADRAPAEKPRTDEQMTNTRTSKQNEKSENTGGHPVRVSMMWLTLYEGKRPEWPQKDVCSILIICIQLGKTIKYF